MVRLAAPQWVGVVCWTEGTRRPRREKVMRWSAGKRSWSGVEGGAGDGGGAWAGGVSGIAGPLVGREPGRRGRDQGPQHALGADAHLGRPPHAVVEAAHPAVGLEGIGGEAG